ncbi:MAG: DUF1343 domain-containing protein [Flavobacteriaceae bacterium]|jgi:uncharacterized protein YbbC (DUF1343 family)|nr:DUF1343 domain-containing protein [Formosa sp.]MDG1375232.1 DUF1343 domain-containing protein [Flavobacteriaceae bacterium]MDG2498038.1 DUF1343 domain-containing protein [Flavobacteriaceae bacterium]
MHLNFIKNTVLLFVLTLLSCRNQSNSQAQTPLRVGAQQTESYLPILKNKYIGIVANQTSVIFKDEGYTHLVDSLLSLNIAVKKVFAPEHGFRGTADAGETIKNGIDVSTGIPIVSLYGKNKKPTQEQLANLYLIIFDIQDVGERFYTFISTLHYLMEACAEAGIPLLVLDRPNPNGHYVDGPILDTTYRSFVGMHPVPIVHGMTVGEYAKMINGEGWLSGSIQCDLRVIPVENYTHQTVYELPIKPSPNLPNAKAINLYPSLCLFEGTNVSVGRGTELQFQILGSPFLEGSDYNFEFIPTPNVGAKYPKHQAKTCKGLNLKEHPILSHIELKWLIDAYQHTENKDDFFIPFFTKLAGQKLLQEQIENGWTADEIRESWKADLEHYKTLRAPYLLYPL